MTIAEAKAKFLAVCADWADVLIDDSVKHVQRGGERWVLENYVEWLPKIAYTGGDEPLPEAQQKVWAAGYALMIDAYDAAKATEQT